MAIQTINGISFEMRETHDFTFLHKYGQVFCVFAQNDSGNISFGLDNGKNKYFVKVAGAKTAAALTDTREAVEILKTSASVYTDLAHPHLIRQIEHFAHKDLYAAVFGWSDGECLFDYWNFETYKDNSELSPRERFKNLSCAKRLHAFDAIFDFLTFTELKGYVAVDFYDGSIMYDFRRDIVTICDIDFFRKSPAINDMGENFWGTKRLKSPEEYVGGAVIDTVTNVFTLGALLFHFFGGYTDDEIGKMYRENAFSPCGYERWELSESLYRTALKAVNRDRAHRYDSMTAFYEAWRANQAAQ
ncbi:MAG: hypothetical protein LBH95_06770 [Oscillospiraceae bacterium]|nr:hypothetical protein [Oscillospiraceae bacterium]